MHYTIENKTDARILLRFNSGLTRHLAPKEVLEGIESVEIKGNSRMESLKDKHIVRVEASSKKAATPAKKKASRSRKRS